MIINVLSQNTVSSSSYVAFNCFIVQIVRNILVTTGEESVIVAYTNIIIDFMDKNLQ